MTNATSETFASYDGLTLAYDVRGTGPAGAPPLVCLPGGPGGSAAYLGGLGGLDRHRRLVLLYSRGTGDSGVPDDPATYRMDRLVEDVEALRAHLGVQRFDLLGHSAAAAVAVLYALAYPHRLDHLVVCNGSLRMLGLPPLGADEAAAARAEEPWYAAAMAAEQAFEQLGAGADAATLATLERALDPFLYGTWDDGARTHADLVAGTKSAAAKDGFYAGFQPDREALRAALAELAVPVLVVAGERDVVPTPSFAAQLAGLFRDARAVTVPAAGHYPWLEDPDGFVAEITSFLAG